MNIKKLLVLGAIFAFLAGCVSTPMVTTDYDAQYDMAGLKTFYVRETKQDTKESLLISPFTLGHVHALLLGEFSKRYQSRTNEADADFIVTYHVVMEEKIEANDFDMMYGYAGVRRYPFPYYRYGNSVNVYNQGSLIIDILDAKTQKPVWRGVSEKRINKMASPQQQREILTGAAMQAIAKFPPIK
jgi:hypothetical protein